jgi:threonine/homoserine/homoserine lactone efflux protein
LTITGSEAALYAVALFILFITHGSVWVAIAARALSGGFASAWPLALGVVVGDVIWPLVAVLGVGWLVSIYADFLSAMKLVAAAIFFAMAFSLIRNADKSIAQDSRLTSPGAWAGFAAGVAVIMSNPKAVLFYMGVLPGFFDLSALTAADIAVICVLSLIVPLLGNLVLAVFVGRVRRLLSSPSALRKVNIASGWMLAAVGSVIGLSYFS